MLGRTDSRLRLILLLVGLITVAVALVVRLAYWQLARGGEMRVLAAAQVETTAQEPAIRGDIFDRHGRLLATTAYRDLLAAYPDRIDEAARTATAARLAGILGLRGAAAQRLVSALGSGSSYAILARQLTPEQSQRIRDAVDAGEVSGLRLEPRPVRLYPNPGGAPETTLASQLLGFVDGEGEGQYGIEQHYQAVLAGQPRLVSTLRGATGLTLADEGRVIDVGSPGADLKLTIDASLQLQLEKELYAAWVADRAQRVSAVVIDPHTGEVLAWGSVPGYDANDFARVASTDPSLFVDPIISQVYEPGSVMKMALATAALGSGTVDADTLIRDTGALRFAGARVDNADKRGMGDIPFEDVFAYSRNVGTARVAFMLGSDVDAAARVLYDTWIRLGFGRLTGVDVARESAGLVSDPDDRPWRPIDLANRAFGQGVAATPLQLATAFGAVASGGSEVNPYLVAEVNEQAVERPIAEQVLEPELAAELERMMVHVVTAVPWYAEGTLIPGYHVGGKTGTAQIWDSDQGRWIWNTFNFSFVGFAGRTAPEAVIAVRIHDTRPLVRGQGNFDLEITSYELFRRIAVDTMAALDVQPFDPDAVPVGLPPELRPPMLDEDQPDGRDSASIAGP